MDKQYIIFILGYDYGKVFESMDLTCDEAFDLASEIANRLLTYVEEGETSLYYDVVQEYCDNISFEEIWEQMRRK